MNIQPSKKSPGLTMVKNYKPLSCAECTGGQGLDFDFTMAYQPIVNVSGGHVFAHEALVRGLNGESAGVFWRKSTMKTATASIKPVASMRSAWRLN